MKFDIVQKSPLANMYRNFSSSKKKKNKKEAPHVLIHDSPTFTENPCQSSDASIVKNADHISANVAGEKLLAVFAYLDGDGDGKVSAEELRKSVNTLSEEDAEEAVRLWDIDGDGKLDFGEFQKLLEGGGEEGSEGVREAFRMYVEERSECITPASLRRMLSRLGESRSIDDCKMMIGAFDLDGDGVLSFDEFVVMMR